jgi:CHAT domain-containing protein
VARLKEALALPSVKQEIADVTSIVPGVTLLNGDFTRDRFTKEAESGKYRVIHIASHGVFGGNASSSYILAYDELLTMNDLEKMLRGSDVEANPIDLLTLSACETAEGNDRAPLGISGVAIKAKARSVVGTLWPVSDEAARQFMPKFYEGFIHKGFSKAVALQAAQREMLKHKDFSHPFFWAPFVVIGSWL